MRKVVQFLLVLILVGWGVLTGTTAANAQTNGGEVTIVVIDGVEYVLEPGQTLPGDIPLQPIPPELLAGVPPEYAFFVDASLPVPPGFEWLDDPSLPVPPKFHFLFDPTLPVPEDFLWLVGGPTFAAPQQAVPTPAPTAIPTATATPEPEPTTTSEPEDALEPADVEPVGLAPNFGPATEEVEATDSDQSVADEGTAIEESGEADEIDADNDDTPDVVPVVAESPASRANPVAVVSGREPTTGLMVPLLIFVAVASAALLAAVPIFLRQRSTSETALRELALTDDLTKLANRRRLDRDLDAHQRTNKPVAVAMIDIDHFKRLNDDFGHAVGDIVLQHIAAALSENVRHDDVAYRYGGEEFCVLLPNATELEAAAVVDRVRRVIEKLTFAEVNRPVTISAGVAVAFDRARRNGSETVQVADAALYEAKHTGRNRVMLSSLMGSVTG